MPVACVKYSVKIQSHAIASNPIPLDASPNQEACTSVNWTLTFASLRRRRRRSSVPASSLLGARASDSGMRYTSNDAPRGITLIAVRGVARSATGVYMRVRLRASYMRGQDAWPAGWLAGWPASGALLSLDLARSCSLVVVRSMLLFPRSKLLRTLLSSSAGAPSSAWHRRRGTARRVSLLASRPAI